MTIVQEQGKSFKFTLKAWDGSDTNFFIVAKDEEEARKNLAKSFQGYLTQLKFEE